MYLISTFFKNPCILNLLNNFLVIRQKNWFFLYKTTFNGIKAASILPVKEIHAEDHHKVDWKKCIICQETNFQQKSFIVNGLNSGVSVSLIKKVPALEFLKWLTVVRLERSATMLVKSSAQEY